MLESFQPNELALYGVGSIVVVIVLRLLFGGGKKTETPSIKEAADQSKYTKYSQQTVILHIFPRWRSQWPAVFAPELQALYDREYDDDVQKNLSEEVSNRFVNASQFCSKLEVLLVYYGIPYEVDYTSTMSSKSKSPWVTYYDQSMQKWVNLGDSQIIINKLLQQLDGTAGTTAGTGRKGRRKSSDAMDKFDWFYSEYPAEDQLYVHSLRVLLEESVYFMLAYHRWVDNQYEYLNTLFGGMGVPSFLMPLVRWHLGGGQKNFLHELGIGRHTREEFYGMFKLSIDKIVSKIPTQNTRSTRSTRSKKKFLFGADITNMDCILFSFLMSIFERQVSHYKGFADFYGDDTNPLIIYKDKVERYCINVRIKLEQRFLENVAETEGLQGSEGLEGENE